MTTTRFDFDPRHAGPCDRHARRALLRAGGAALLAPLVAPLAGCGGAAVAFAPFFPFTFQGVVDRRVVAVTFSPDDASNGKTSGRFETVNCFINVRDAAGASAGSNFSGSFDGRALEITLVTPPAPLAAVYDGEFVEDDTVLLTPRGGGAAITVRRNTNDRFLPTLTGDWSGQDASGLAWRLRLDTEPLNSDADATVLLVGTELRGGAAAVALQGYASIDFIELRIARAGGTAVLTGTLVPAAAPPPAGEPQRTETIRFDGGGTLQRVP